MNLKCASSLCFFFSRQAFWLSHVVDLPEQVDLFYHSLYVSYHKCIGLYAGLDEKISKPRSITLIADQIP